MISQISWLSSRRSLADATMASLGLSHHTARLGLLSD